MQSQVIDFYGIHKFIYVLFIAADTSCLDINSRFTISSSGELISPTQNYNLQPKNWGTSANINRIGVHFPIVCIFSGLNCGSILPSNEQKTQIKSTSICIFILLFSFRSFGFLLALWLRSKFSNSIKFYIFPATQRFHFFSSGFFTLEQVKLLQLEIKRRNVARWANGVWWSSRTKGWLTDCAMNNKGNRPTS